MMDKCCGTCALYSENAFPVSRGWKDARACCADVAHEMPASWKPDNYMHETSGSDCCLWEPVRIASNHPHPKETSGE